MWVHGRMRRKKALLSPTYRKTEKTVGHFCALRDAAWQAGRKTWAVVTCA